MYELRYKLRSQLPLLVLILSILSQIHSIWRLFEVYRVYSNNEYGNFFYFSLAATIIGFIIGVGVPLLVYLKRHSFQLFAEGLSYFMILLMMISSIYALRSVLWTTHLDTLTVVVLVLSSFIVVLSYEKGILARLFSHPLWIDRFVMTLAFVTVSTTFLVSAVQVIDFYFISQFSGIIFVNLFEQGITVILIALAVIINWVGKPSKALSIVFNTVFSIVVFLWLGVADYQLYYRIQSSHIFEEYVFSFKELFVYLNFGGVGIMFIVYAIAKIVFWNQVVTVSPVVTEDSEEVEHGTL